MPSDWSLTAAFSRIAVTTFVASCLITQPVMASDELRLASVAAADGFTYAWLPTESGVVLTRPGMRVVLRAGRLLYEVNNATPIADRAPRFDGEDLLISPLLAKRLRVIAQQTAITASPATDAAHAALAPGPEQPITIAASPVPGKLALAISGSGTPNTSVAITLTGEISRELPAVVLQRAVVPVNAKGTYAVQMAYGFDAHPRTTIIATAVSAADDANRAVAHITVDGGVPGMPTSGLDDWPKN
jgi:hypothetical protein